MRVKFFEYVTKANKHGVRIVDGTIKYNPPLAHCINGKIYFPINTTGGFEQFRGKVWR